MTLQEALELALEFGRHSEGCSAACGDEYRCKCGWRECKPQIEEALKKAVKTYHFRGTKMKQLLTQRHWTSFEDCPEGGQTFAPGLCIAWQRGPLGRGDERVEPNGCFVETVISAAIGRLEAYQASKFFCSENETALAHLDRALKALESRTKEREERKVEGTHNI